MGGGGAHYGAGAHGYPNGGRLPGAKGYSTTLPPIPTLTFNVLRG